MNKKKIYLTIQSILCVVIVVMLAAASIGIYREGLALKAADPLSWIYTREKVAEAIGPVTPLILSGLLLTVVGLFLGFRDENAEKPAKDIELQRNLIVSRVTLPSSQMKEEQMRQRKLLCGGWAAFAICMIPILIYITNGNHFPNGDLEPVFFALALHVIPWTLIGLGILMITTLLREKSVEREIMAAKEQIELEKAGGRKPQAQSGRKLPDRTGLIRAVLLALAVIMIVAGVFNGSARDVFGKAVKICTECIGLG